MATSKTHVQKWKLDDLRPHPRQAELFPDLPHLESIALAADIKRNGLQHPIEITSDGTIIAGHQRVHAARMLGWTEIEVIVRTDLEDQGSDAIERRLIEDNLNRRQLSPLAKARCIRAIRDITPRELDPTKWQPQRDIRDVIGEQLGISGREVSRYLLVMQTPITVQNAFDSGGLSLVKAGRVAGLSIEDQNAIAARIEAGEEPRQVVDEFLRNTKNKRPNVATQYQTFQKRLREAFEIAPGSLDELSIHSASVRGLKLFEQLFAECRKFIRWEKAGLKQQAAPDSEILVLLQADQVNVAKSQSMRRGKFAKNR